MPLHRNIVNCVCTANICRSPMAARLLEHALEAEGPPLSELHVVSTGISAMEGAPASLNSIKALDKVGLALKGHGSRAITHEIVENSILTICMTESHRYFLEQYFPNLESPVILMRELLDDSNAEIPDPYGLDLPAYVSTRDAMVEAIPSIVKLLKEQAAKQQEQQK